jgi:glycosyltransferase involved in cell wall biosynthesis
VRQIEETYFLSVASPVIIDSKGRRWCNELWAKDLALHLDYIANLTLGCPCEFREPSEFDVSMDNPPFDRIRYIDLPTPRNHVEALLKLPRLIAKMWQGVRSCKIVHTGFGGWPISEGWLAVPIGKVLGRYIITNVESSFWRTKSDASRIQRVRSSVIECINRFCVKIADLRLFTSRSYAEEFLPGTNERAYVIPATWIDAKIILGIEEARDSWASKRGCVRLLFAGRLITDKGVRVLIDALRVAANQHKSPLEIVIIGSGELWHECSDLVREIQSSSVRVSLLEPVSYGAPFLNLLRGFDAILVPSLSDEQPRLIFDAFSQAVPVLGSNTGGICEVVRDQMNGRIYRRGDASALAATLDWASKNRQALQAMGMIALNDCGNFTHRAMHKARQEILLKELART